MSNMPGKMPVVGEFVRSLGTLVDIQDVTPKPPPGPILDYVFEKKEARVEAYANEKRIQRFSTFNDFYGLGTCVEHAIEEAKKVCQTFGDSVEVRVIKITSYVRKRPHRPTCFYDPQFVGFENLEHGCMYNLPPDVEEMVWSSKTNKE